MLYSDKTMKSPMSMMLPLEKAETEDDGAKEEEAEERVQERCCCGCDVFVAALERACFLRGTIRDGFGLS